MLKRITPALLFMLNNLTVATEDFQGIVQEKQLGDNLVIQYFYETLAADDPEFKEYINIKLIFKDFDVTGWNPGEGFWVGIALGS